MDGTTVLTTVFSDDNRITQRELRDQVISSQVLLLLL